MATYIAISRIRTEGVLFLPGEEVRGLSETDATALLATGCIELSSDTPPKTNPAQKPKPGKKAES